jgi:rare lipoprotein A
VGESSDPDWHRGVVSTFALYGTELACGGRLEASTVGVAHRTLPCGTPVTFRYRGRTVTVPVVDRGPFVAGRDFDLTPVAAARLRLEGVASVDWRRG